MSASVPQSPTVSTAGFPALTATARELYAACLSEGRPPVDAAPEALERLVLLGLLIEDEGGTGGLVPVEPRLAEARLGASWRTAALQLLEQAGDLSEALAPLISAYQENAVPSGESELLVQLQGKALISACVDDAVSRCTQELLTAQPGGGRAATTLETVRGNVAAALSRGVSVRTLYQHTAWHAGPTREFVEEMTRLGAQVRTLDEFFERLIIVDRRTAFLPAAPDRSKAVMVQEPAVVGFLADIFDRNWQRATEFTGLRSPERSVEITGSLQELIVRGLIEGESDPVIAKRIGLSQRSYASHLARMKEELGVDTRFQLGYRLAKSGAALAAPKATAVSRANSSGRSSMMLCPAPATGRNRTPAAVSSPGRAGTSPCSPYSRVRGTDVPSSISRMVGRVAAARRTALRCRASGSASRMVTAQPGSTRARVSVNPPSRNSASE